MATQEERLRWDADSIRMVIEADAKVVETVRELLRKTVIPEPPSSAR